MEAKDGNSARNTETFPHTPQIKKVDKERSPLWDTLFQRLQTKVKPIPISGECVRILSTPTEFYDTIISKIQSSSSRISLAALYLGTGDLEENMLKVMAENLSKNPSLRVSVVMDCLRGTRMQNQSSTATLFTPLVKEYPNQAKVTFFHTPLLSGIMRDIIPARVNELAGVQHVKGAVFDDTVILTGANLGDHYFVNRQDRYILIESKLVADHFFNLFEGMQSISYELKPDGNLIWPSNVPNVHDNYDEYIQYSRNRLMEAFTRYQSALTNEAHEADTWIFPTIQMGPCEIRIDEEVTREFLKSATHGSGHVTISSPYFNLITNYIEDILESRDEFSFIVASPKANGFFNASGFSGYIPTIYATIERDFFMRCAESNKLISVSEYSRPEWTFHSKGMWYQFKQDDSPCATMIGSSNYGRRSAHRDLEAQAVIMTENLHLRKELGKELSRIKENCKVIQASDFGVGDRSTTYMSWIAAKVVGRFM